MNIQYDNWNGSNFVKQIVEPVQFLRLDFVLIVVDLDMLFKLIKEYYHNNKKKHDEQKLPQVGHDRIGHHEQNDHG